jgi:hypothetical protein
VLGRLLGASPPSGGLVASSATRDDKKLLVSKTGDSSGRRQGELDQETSRSRSAEAVAGPHGRSVAHHDARRRNQTL